MSELSSSGPDRPAGSISPLPLSAEEPGLADLRERIDAVDKALLDLLNQRAQLSLAVKAIKGPGGPVFRPLRERAIVENLLQVNSGPLPALHIQSIWREIFSSSRSLQQPLSVAYLGPEGTHSYFSAREHLGQLMEYQACASFRDVFTSVQDGFCSLGVIPIENSLHGSVVQNFDLFTSFDVFIQAEFFSRIQHSLLSHAASLADIQTVYSHPQALAQCQDWLRKQLPQAVPVAVESTAAAARRCITEPRSAAIAHRSLSVLLSIPLVASHLEDEPDNQTRFLIIGPQPVENASADRTSVLFTLPDRPGALAGILELFAGASINLRKLESRPLRAERWKYAFFADLEANLCAPAHAEHLRHLHDACASFRILGCYTKSGL